MNKDILKASAIAGGSIGFVTGFMRKGEELEDHGSSSFGQFTGGIGGGIVTGAAGTGIGIGVSSTAAALKKILRS